MQSSLKDVGYKRNTSITLLALGQVFLHHEEPKEALPFLLRSRGISENLLNNDENNGETIADLAQIYGNLGAALAKTAKLGEGLSNQEKSLEFFNRSLAKSPENNELKHSFAEIAEQTAETYIQLAKRENSEKAKEFREKANLLSEQSRQAVER